MLSYGPGRMFASQQITPSLRLVRQLGEGGMGSVWAAHHDGLGVEVAVKFVSKVLASDPSALARFKREATAAARLASSHVVRVFDHGVTTEAIPYIVMELLLGEDLGDRIDREGALPLGDVTTVVQQSCKALSKAHQLGLVHRDIKPDNIYLTHEDDELLVKILDFGVAKQSIGGSMEMTSTGAMMGTPYYMSPEQVLSAKHVDHRADLWALAVVAYHALTGQRPFEADTLGALCVKINDGRFAPLRALRTDVPAALEPWFARALARDPEQRFQSAKELATAFAAAASAMTTSAPQGSFQPVDTTAERRPSQPSGPATAMRWVETFQADAVPLGSNTPAPQNQGSPIPAAAPVTAPMPVTTAPGTLPADRLAAITAQSVAGSTVGGASSTVSEQKLRPTKRLPVLPILVGIGMLLAMATGVFLGGRALFSAMRGAPVSSDSAAVAALGGPSSANTNAVVARAEASSAGAKPVEPQVEPAASAEAPVAKVDAGTKRSVSVVSEAPQKAPNRPVPKPSKASSPSSEKAPNNWGF
jgi:eukaryotic-like serine/threonine-protein kinase